MKGLHLAAMSQQQVESRAGSLDLLGLLVLSNYLRRESKDTILHLQDRYAANAAFSGSTMVTSPGCGANAIAALSNSDAKHAGT